MTEKRKAGRATAKQNIKKNNSCQMPESRHRMISEAAYFRALEHGFTPGNDLHDWLEAEREIDRLLSRS